MKNILVVLLLVLNLSSYSQAKNISEIQRGIVTFITTLDAANATKDGIYLNGYVVNLDYEKITELNGKKIKVTGKVRIIKGLKNIPHSEGYQGRQDDYGYIKNPKVEIIKE